MNAIICIEKHVLKLPFQFQEVAESQGKVEFAIIPMSGLTCSSAL